MAGPGSSRQFRLHNATMACAASQPSKPRARLVSRVSVLFLGADVILRDRLHGHGRVVFIPPERSEALSLLTRFPLRVVGKRDACGIENPSLYRFTLEYPVLPFEGDFVSGPKLAVGGCVEWNWIDITGNRKCFRGKPERSHGLCSAVSHRQPELAVAFLPEVAVQKLQRTGPGTGTDGIGRHHARLHV